MLRALQNQRRRSADAGFTLIELLIVIIILGVLAAIVVFSVKGITNKGDLAACQSEVSTVDTAIEAFVAQSPTNAYPGSLSDLVPNYLHSAPTKYVTGLNATGDKVTLAAGAPAGCTAS